MPINSSRQTPVETSIAFDRCDFTLGEYKSPVEVVKETRAVVIKTSTLYSAPHADATGPGRVLGCRTRFRRFGVTRQDTGW